MYSIHYNPAKYAFLDSKLSIGLGYSPWLRNLVPDMNLAYLAAAYKINDRSAVAVSLRYFSAGEVDFSTSTTSLWALITRTNGLSMLPIHVCSAIICRVPWQVVSSIPT